jgi:hypothetical protein
VEPVLGIIGAFVLALTVAVLVFTHQRNKNPSATPFKWEAAGAVAGVMSAIGGALLGASLVVGGAVGKTGDETVAQVAPEPTATIAATPTSPSPQEVSFEKPQDGGTFPTCGLASGKATLADDQVVVVGEREPGDRRWYLESSVRYNGSRTAWDVDLQLGEMADKKKDLEFDIIALVMSKKVADYLASTQTEKNEFGEALTYWSSVDLPPTGVYGYKQIQVTRVPDTTKCSSG